MAEIIQAAPLRAYDSNGDLVAGAKLYVFESGTTTEETVYQDEALTTPFAQPILANAAGVFAPIYAAAGTNLKVTVTDADDAVLAGYPIDPVSFSSTAATGASQISFSPVTGNSATNVQTAIENLTTLWNAVTTYSRTLLAKATAAEWRTALGLGGLATLDILDEDDFASDSATEPPSQQSTGAYIATQIAANVPSSVEELTCAPTIQVGSMAYNGSIVTNIPETTGGLLIELDFKVAKTGPDLALPRMNLSFSDDGVSYVSLGEIFPQEGAYNENFTDLTAKISINISDGVYTGYASMNDFGSPGPYRTRSGTVASMPASVTHIRLNSNSGSSSDDFTYYGAVTVTRTAGTS